MFPQSFLINLIFQVFKNFTGIIIQMKFQEFYPNGKWNVLLYHQICSSEINTSFWILKWETWITITHSHFNCSFNKKQNH